MNLDPKYGMVHQLNQPHVTNRQDVLQKGRAYADQKITELLDPSQAIQPASFDDYHDICKNLKALTQIEPDELHSQITALYQQVIRVSNATEKAKYLDCVCQVERILHHSDAPLHKQFVRLGTLPSCDTIKTLTTFKPFEETLDALRPALEHYSVSLFISYETSADALKEMLVKHLIKLGVKVNQESILNTDPNKHYEQVYQRDYVLVLGTPGYRKTVPEAAMVQDRWLKQQHRILRVLLADQVETSFPTLLNTGAVPFIDLVREDQYFSAFFQIIERLFSTTLDDHSDLKERIKSFRTEIPQFPTPIPPPSSYSILKSQLRSKYQQQWFLKRFKTDKLFPIATSFIKLVHVLEEEQAKKEQDASKITVDYLNTHEAIYNAKEAISLQNLFSPGKQEVHNHILIEGRAGIGKSTFCRYIAHLWGKLNREERERQLGPWANHYQLLLWIPLRELNKTIDSSLSIESLIKRLCFPATTNQTDLTTMLNDASCSILYILDGYDEIAHIKQEFSHRCDLLNQLLEKPNWIITSRPNFYREWSDPKILHLENIGFTTEDITNFSRRFFEDFDKKEKIGVFNTLISHSTTIRLMAHIPINLELICTHLLDNTLSENITLTEVYTAIKRDLFRRCITHRLGDNEIDAHPMHRFLESVAWDAMQKYSLHLSPEFFDAAFQYVNIKQNDRNHFLSQVKDSLGFLTPSSYDKHRDKTYYFIHLTFQEYFAACYFAKLFSSDSDRAKNWLIRNKFDRRYEMMILFTAGLLSVSNHQFTIFIKTLLSPPSSYLEIHELCLAVRCLINLWNRVENDKITEIQNRFLELLRHNHLGTPIFHKHIGPILKHNPDLLSQPVFQNFYLDQLENEKSRSDAIGVLHYIKPNDAKICCALIKLLEDPSETNYRYKIEEILYYVHSSNHLVISALIDFLKNSRNKVAKTQLRYIFRHIKPTAQDQIEKIVQLLDENNPDLRIAVMNILVEIDTKHPVVAHKLVSLLKEHPSTSEVKTAILTLSTLKIDIPEVPQVLCDLMNFDNLEDAFLFRQEIHHLAVNALAEAYPCNSLFLEKLLNVLKTLKDSHSYVLWICMSALKTIIPHNPNIIPRLIKESKQCIDDVRTELVESLAQCSPSSPLVLEECRLLLCSADTNEKLRYTAVKALESNAFRDPRLNLTLVKLINNSDIKTKRCAAGLLLKQYPEDSATLLVLVRTLKDEDLGEIIVNGLAYLKLNDKNVFEELERILDDGRGRVKKNAAKLLIQLKPENPKLLSKLIDLLRDDTCRDTVKRSLCERRVDPTVIVRHLYRLLEDPNQAVVFSVIEIFEAINPDDVEFQEKLINLLDTNAVRDQVVQVLLRLKPDIEIIVRKLESLSSERCIEVRNNLLKVLQAQEPDHPRILQELINVSLDHADKQMITRVLNNLKAPSPQVIKLLSNLIDCMESDNQVLAVKKLIEFKIDETNLNTLLVQCLMSENKQLRDLATEALISKNFSEMTEVNKLIEILKKDNQKASAYVVQVVLHFKEIKPEVQRELVDLLKNGGKSVRSAVKTIFTDRLPNDPSTIETLQLLLKDKNKLVRLDAIEILLKLRNHCDGCKEILIDLLSDKNPKVQRQTIRLIAKIKLSEPKIIQRLLHLMKGENTDVILQAIFAMGALNVREQDFINALQGCLRSSNQDIVFHSAGALVNLGKRDSEIIAGYFRLLSSESGKLKYRIIDKLTRVGLEDQMILRQQISFLSKNDPKCLGELPPLINAMGGKLEVATILEIVFSMRSLDVDGSDGINDYKFSSICRLIDSQDPKVVISVVNLLRRPNSYFLKLMALNISELNIPASLISSEMVALLNDSDPSVRWSVMVTVEYMLENHKPVDPTIQREMIKLLENEESKNIASRCLKKWEITEPSSLLELFRLSDSSWIPKILGMANDSAKSDIELILDLNQSFSTRSMINNLQAESDRDRKELWRQLFMLHVNKNASLLFEQDGKIYFEEFGELTSFDAALLKGSRDESRDSLTQVVLDIMRMRPQALGTYSESEFRTSEVARALIPILADQDSDMKEKAKKALCLNRPDDLTTIQALIGQMNNPAAAPHAASVLIAIQPHNPEVQCYLVSLLEQRQFRDVIYESLTKVKITHFTVMATLLHLTRIPLKEISQPAWQLIDSIPMEVMTRGYRQADSTMKKDLLDFFLAYCRQKKCVVTLHRNLLFCELGTEVSSIPVDHVLGYSEILPFLGLTFDCFKESMDKTKEVFFAWDVHFRYGEHLAFQRKNGEKHYYLARLALKCLESVFDLLPNDEREKLFEQFHNDFIALLRSYHQIKMWDKHDLLQFIPDYFNTYCFYMDRYGDWSDNKSTNQLIHEVQQILLKPFQEFIEILHGEIAIRKGDAAKAARHFQKALQMSKNYQEVQCFTSLWEEKYLGAIQCVEYQKKFSAKRTS